MERFVFAILSLACGYTVFHTAAVWCVWCVPALRVAVASFLHKPLLPKKGYVAYTLNTTK